VASDSPHNKSPNCLKHVASPLATIKPPENPPVIQSIDLENSSPQNHLFNLLDVLPDF
jgi:hypothetical protein